jgi:hypothetical protein
MALTTQECRIAASQAERYPAGCGFIFFVGIQLTPEQLDDLDPDCEAVEDDPLSWPSVAANYATKYPEDLDKG